MLKQPLRSLSTDRDKFFDILRTNNLLIVPKRSYHITTNSRHSFKKHKNMILDYQISKPNQVWVADITCIGNRKNPSYLSLITDAFSKKIVGHHVADNLNTESSLTALKKVFKKQKSEFGILNTSFWPWSTRLLDWITEIIGTESHKMQDDTKLRLLQRCRCRRDQWYFKIGIWYW